MFTVKQKKKALDIYNETQSVSKSFKHWVILVFKQCITGLITEENQLKKKKVIDINK